MSHFTDARLDTLKEYYVKVEDVLRRRGEALNTKEKTGQNQEAIQHLNSLLITVENLKSAYIPSATLGSNSIVVERLELEGPQPDSFFLPLPEDRYADLRILTERTHVRNRLENFQRRLTEPEETPWILVQIQHQELVLPLGCRVLCQPYQLVLQRGSEN